MEFPRKGENAASPELGNLALAEGAKRKARIGG